MFQEGRNEKKLKKKAFLHPYFCYTPTPPAKKNPNIETSAVAYALIKLIKES